MRALRPADHSVQRRAFSLVEVALAVGVLAVALVGVFALLPSGLASFQSAMDTSISSQIAQRLLQDAQQAEFDELVDRRNLPVDSLGNCPERFSFRAPSVKAPAWRYFDEQGTEVAPGHKNGLLTLKEHEAVVYHVNTRIRPRAEMPTLRESRGQVAQITVQVARSPGGKPLELEKSSNSPEHNLIKHSNRVPIFTYSALIGKNQGQ